MNFTSSILTVLHHHRNSAMFFLYPASCVTPLSSAHKLIREVLQRVQCAIFIDTFTQSRNTTQAKTLPMASWHTLHAWSIVITTSAELSLLVEECWLLCTARRYLSVMLLAVLRNLCVHTASQSLGTILLIGDEGISRCDASTSRANNG